MVSSCGPSALPLRPPGPAPLRPPAPWPWSGSRNYYSQDRLLLPGRESSGRIEAPRSPRIPSAALCLHHDVLPTARPAAEAPVLLSPPPPPFLLWERQTYAPSALCSRGPAQEDPGGNGSPAPAWGPERKSLVHAGCHCRTLPPDHPQVTGSQAHHQKPALCMRPPPSTCNNETTTDALPVTGDVGLYRHPAREALTPLCREAL